MAQLLSQQLKQSELISTLMTRVYNNEIQLENFQFELQEIFSSNIVMDGNKDYNYTELFAEELASDIGDDIKLSDLNGTGNKAVRFTETADVKVNAKVRILEQAYADFISNPNDDTLAQFFASIQGISKYIADKTEKEIWKSIDKYGVVIPAGSDAIGTDKILYKQLLDYQTTSKSHVGVGTEPATAAGVIKDLDNNQIQPLQKFKSADFIRISQPDLDTGIEYDGNRTMFGWGRGNKMEIYKQITLNFEQYAGIDGLTFTNIKKDKTKVILMHKNAIEVLMKWKKTETDRVVNGKITTRTYAKIKAVKRHNYPILIFNDPAHARSAGIDLTDIVEPISDEITPTAPVKRKSRKARKAAAKVDPTTEIQ